MKQIKLDRINQAILKVLQGNARTSNMELAEKVNLSPSACLQRTKALEDAGYIRKYMAAINLDAISEHVLAYVMLKLRDHAPHKKDEFERLIQHYEELIDCLRVDGEYDYIALACCSTVEDLDAFRDQMLKENDNLQQASCQVVLAKTKWFAGYPLESLRWRS